MLLILDEPDDHKKRKYQENIEEDDGGYSPSHPGIKCGALEKELLERLHHSTPSRIHSKSTKVIPADTTNEPPIPCELSNMIEKQNEDGKPLERKARKQRKASYESVEDGEIVSDEEVQCIEKEEENNIKEKSNQGWWLTVPLEPTLKPCTTLNPPPPPCRHTTNGSSYQVLYQQYVSP